MNVTEDAFELVKVLAEEGFGELAAEVLAEISLGRPVADSTAASPEAYGLDEFSRTPLVDSELLGEAIRIIRLRLVEPERRFAEAQRIAASIVQEASLPIPFVGANGEIDPRMSARADPPGEPLMANKLDEILDRFASSSQPGAPNGA